MTGTDVVQRARVRASAAVARVRKSAAIDPTVFAHHVLRDETGGRLDVAPLHEALTAHVTWAWSRKLVAVVIVPWGHGKTIWLTCARVLWEVGRNPSLRVRIVCNDDDSAKARVRYIARAIESERFRTVFPAVRQAERRVAGVRDPWSMHEIRVASTGGGEAVDPTVAASGVLSTGVGTRCDVLIGDDVVDMRNALANPGLRRTVRETWESVWEARRESAGRTLYLSTPWHAHDLTAHMKTRGGGAVFEAPVSRDVDGLDVSVSVPGGELADDYPAPKTATLDADDVLRWRLPLWDARWPREALLLEKQTD